MQFINDENELTISKLSINSTTTMTDSLQDINWSNSTDSDKETSQTNKRAIIYMMLTAIRSVVSILESKPMKVIGLHDFGENVKLEFDQKGTTSTPVSKYDFKFKDYSPWIFRKLRSFFGIDAADYLISLTDKLVLIEKHSSGKSGSLFYYSQDLRFIIKTIHPSEHKFFRKILFFYYEYICQNQNTLLARIYGLHRLKISQNKLIYFTVMGNIFPPHKDIHEIYDLKGSTFGRIVEKESQTDRAVTLKDLNWIQRKRHLILGPKKATSLMNQLKNDCKFLAKMNIMDYSLLIGIHDIKKGNVDKVRQNVLTLLKEDRIEDNQVHFEQNYFKNVPKERKFCTFYSDEGGYQSTFKDNSCGSEIYYVGIIDIFTPYSLIKRVEHAFKSLQYDKSTISAVSPVAYMDRFIAFMSLNILQNIDYDYSKRELPNEPQDYSVIDENDTIHIIQG